jgi:hypothetical protein
VHAFGRSPKAALIASAVVKSFTVFAGADGFPYQFYLDADERIIVRRVDQEHPFRQLELAVMIILNCLGEFSEAGA